MAEITKKISPEWFQAILDGKKNYELRLNDFEINEGDTLILHEHDNNRELTGRKIEKQVTYVGKFKVDELFWPKETVEEKGLQIIAFK